MDTCDECDADIQTGFKFFLMTFIYLLYIRFDIQTEALDCDLWPLRPAGRQTDPGSWAENQASSDTECCQHHRGGLSPAQPGMPYTRWLPRTAAGGAAHRVVAGHRITELESVQHDKSYLELAQTENDSENSK